MTPEKKKLKKIYDKFEDKSVSFGVFCNRVTTLGWSHERAATEKLQKTSERRAKYMEIYERLEGEKVDFDLFYSRIVAGVSIVEASLIKDRISEARKFYLSCKNPEVSYQTFRSRVDYLGWDMSRAVSTPKFTNRVAKNRVVKPSELRRWYDRNKNDTSPSWDAFSRRVRTYKWGRDRAIAQPVRGEGITLREYYLSKKKPQVSLARFIQRVSVYGWTRERAISEKAFSPTSLSTIDIKKEFKNE